LFFPFDFQKFGKAFPGNRGFVLFKELENKFTARDGIIVFLGFTTLKRVSYVLFSH
jgi:hypothetical protein